MIAPRKPREAGNVKHHILFRVNIQYFQCRVHPVSNCYPFGKYGPFCGGYLPKKGESLVAFSRFGSMVRMEKMGSLTVRFPLIMFPLLYFYPSLIRIRSSICNGSKPFRICFNHFNMPVKRLNLNAKLTRTTTKRISFNTERGKKQNRSV